MRIKGNDVIHILTNATLNSEPQLRELEILTSNYLSLNLKEKAATAERFLKKIAAFMVHFDGEVITVLFHIRSE